MIGMLFVWGSAVLSVVATVFCIVAMIRRYWLCYWDYVNDEEIERIPDEIVDSYNTWHMWWSCNATGTWLHLCMGWIFLVIVSWTWFVSIPILIVNIVSTHHREKIRKRKKFEATLKGEERADLVEDMINTPGGIRSRTVK